MTVSYSSKISTAHLGAFLKLLTIWRGSVYKLLWRELLVFLVLYYAINFTYRFLLSDHQKEMFEDLSHYCDKYANNIPLTFVLGFYVTTIYRRWWAQFQTSFMREDELKLYESVETHYPKEYVPCVWAANLFVIARKEGLVDNDRSVLELYKEVNEFRQTVRATRYYDWISVPLVYTQVVTIAVYSFYLTCLLGRQELDQIHISKLTKTKASLDIYFPAFTFLQLIIYIGWLKVAEVMMNPFGEDDDDFEIDFVLERNLEVGYVIADDLYNISPPIMFEQPAVKLRPPKLDAQHRQLSGYFGSTTAVKDEFEQTLSGNIYSTCHARGLFDGLWRRMKTIVDFRERRSSDVSEDNFLEVSGDRHGTQQPGTSCKKQSMFATNTVVPQCSGSYDDLDLDLEQRLQYEFD